MKGSRSSLSVHIPSDFGDDSMSAVARIILLLLISFALGSLMTVIFFKLLFW